MLPATLVGTIAAPGDSNRYEFDGKAGEDVVFEVIASKLGSRLESLLTLSDSQAGFWPRQEDTTPALTPRLTTGCPRTGNTPSRSRTAKAAEERTITIAWTRAPCPTSRDTFLSACAREKLRPWPWRASTWVGSTSLRSKRRNRQRRARPAHHAQGERSAPVEQGAAGGWRLARNFGDRNRITLLLKRNP